MFVFFGAFFLSCIHIFVFSFSFICFIPLQEECVLSDPQGESDADADIEDTDCRFDVHEHTCVSPQYLFAFDLVPLPRLVQTPGARVSPANKLAETQAPARIAARHHRERRRRWAEPQITSLEPQAQSWQSTQQDHTGGKIKQKQCKV